MRLRKTTAAILMFAAFVPAATWAQAQAAAPSQAAQPAVDPQKEQSIRHLLNLLNVPKVMEQAMGPMLAQMTKSIVASSPADPKLQRYSDLLNQKMVEKMKNLDYAALFVPVYDKYFTEDDIKALITFYESPVGAKSLQLQSQMMIEASTRVLPVVQQLANDAEKEIRKEHPELAPDTGA